MYGAVVKFHPLADANGAGAQHNDLAGLGDLHLVLLCMIGGIVIRRSGLELGGAGIDHLVAGCQMLGEAQGTHFIRGFAGQLRYGAVSQADALRPG